MARQIVKQPDGRYAVWSSIVDDFVLVDSTKEGLIRFALREIEQDIRESTDEVIAKLDAGKKPYHQFTCSFDDCLRLIRETHGDGAETLRHFKRKPEER